jgi:mycothiol synthase
MNTNCHLQFPIDVSGAPPIAGLIFRRFRGEVDYPVMVAILDACNVADDYVYINTVTDVASTFAHLKNCDPYRDMLFAEVDGETIAFSRVWWGEEGDTRLYIPLGFVHPAWRRKGLGTAMLHYNEARLREIAREHPAGDKFFRVWTTDKEYGAWALFTKFGYEPVRHYIEMSRPNDVLLPNAPMPVGLEVRPVAPEQYRAVWDAKEEARQDHWGYAPATDADFERWTETRTFAPHLWKVAWDGDQVAGMVLNRLDVEENAQYGRKRGYTKDIFVRRPWRRRGLARSLLVQSIEMFKVMGMEETALGVDTQNPSGALRLYESVGYQEGKRHTFFNKRME